MIKFFRHTRRHLFSEHKFHKYFFYAIGEIILVVIGILIAVQINSWNEHVKEKKEELRILSKLEIDLQSDIIQLDKHIKNAQFRQQQIDSIYLALDTPDKYPVEQFAYWHLGIAFEDFFSVNSGTYDESLSSATLKLIQNDSLREQVFDYYRAAKENYHDVNTVKQIYDQIVPTFFEVFGSTKQIMALGGLEAEFMTELVVSNLIQDKKYTAMIAHKYMSQNTQILIWQNLLEQVKELLKMLRKNL